MNPYVDKFIIVVSDVSFTGTLLNISFYPFEKEIMQFKHKMVIKKISMKDVKGSTWKRENYQRQSIYDVLKEEKIKENDIILVSDCDEIPTKEAMDYIIKKPPNTTTVFTGNFYYYNYRNLINNNWYGTTLFRGNDYKNIQKARNNHHLPQIPFISLSHCSYCYPRISMIQKKLKSFSHTEFNKKPYIDKSYIIENIKTHKSLFDKNKFNFVNYNNIINPLPNDERLNFLKEEYGIIEDDLDDIKN